ncbi:hypothetical protein O5831_03810 [Escherichia coli]|nr:hypothetical protein [Escherichia coli]
MSLYIWSIRPECLSRKGYRRRRFVLHWLIFQTGDIRTTPSVAEQEGHLMEMEATQAP